MSLTYMPRQTVVNGNGRPYAGARAWFYRAGTTTAQSVYSDAARATPHTNPVVANAAGRFPSIYLDPSNDYRCIVKDSSGTTLFDDDNIPSSVDVSHPKTDAETSAGVTPVNYAVDTTDYYNVARYFNGTIDDDADITEAVQSALTVAKGVVLPAFEMKMSQVIVPANSWIRGVHRKTVLKPLDDTVTKMLNITGTGYPTGAKTFVKLSDLMLYNGAATDACSAIYARFFDELFLQDVIVDGFLNNLHISNGAFVYGRNVRSWSADAYCLYLKCDQNSSHTGNVGFWASFIDSEFCGGTGSYNAYVEDWATVRFHKTEFDSSAGVGLLIKQAYTASLADAADVVVSACGFDSNEGIGLKLDTIRAFTVAHNWFSSGRTEAVEGVNVSACRQGSIVDNDFANCGDSGLQVTNSQEIGIHGNRAYANGQSGSGQRAGIRLSASTYCTVTENKCINESYGFGTETQQVGITEDGASDYNIFRNNIATSNVASQFSFLGGANSIYRDNLGATVTGNLLSGSATYDPSSLADGAGVTTTVTVTGAALGDFVEGISASVDLQGIVLTGYVSAANTVAVRYQNETTGAIDLASHTLRVRVRKV